MVMTEGRSTNANITSANALRCVVFIINSVIINLKVASLLALTSCIRPTAGEEASCRNGTHRHSALVYDCPGGSCFGGADQAREDNSSSMREWTSVHLERAPPARWTLRPSVGGIGGSRHTPPFSLRWTRLDARWTLRWTLQLAPPSRCFLAQFGCQISTRSPCLILIGGGRRRLQIVHLLP
jgi:hypothetical protein